MSSEDHTGRVAVITGASSGIGEATARALATTGHRLALLARRADRIEALATELGNGAIAITADVTDRDALAATAERVQSELGGADILVNNAGVMLLAPFSAEQHAESRQMGRGQPARRDDRDRSVPRPAPQRRGRPGQHLLRRRPDARPGNAVYAATKWGINGWSEAMRQELQPDVRVTVIAPGAVATELTDHITHAAAKQMAEGFYEQVAITAQDIAEIIAFAITRPQRVTLNEILIRPTAQT
jgi:NADP-dependent 3-hydroxy acid dehydrogenase YdfG